MSTPPASLAARHSDFTQRLIVDAAITLLAEAPVRELSIRSAAKQAGVSERTVFRYFQTREDFLDAVATEMAARLKVPVDPADVGELLDYPRAIFSRFEETAALTRAALHSELYDRMRRVDTEKRAGAIRVLVDRVAPGRSEAAREIASAQIRYYLIATTWHYYRFYFGFDQETCIRAARQAIAQALRGLGVEDAAIDAALAEQAR
ncbi:MAG: TetR/AcrR family transcriptional regulator [Methylocystis sp.]|uniref:TetR/AcrR family transcriptional regulator n=1 Tax=Methylocystis sp. TaxID=1911079 RepID=UPI003DA40C04